MLVGNPSKLAHHVHVSSYDMCLLMLWLVAITEEPLPAEEPSLEADLSYEDLRCEDDCGPNGRQSSYLQFCAGVLHEVTSYVAANDRSWSRGND